MKFSAGSVIFSFSAVLILLNIILRYGLEMGFNLIIVHLDCILSITFCVLLHEAKK